jgi:hypothetical protein
MSCPYCHTSVVVPEELRQSSGAAAWSTLLFDNFAKNDHDWLVGNETSEYFAPLSRVIADGRYRWEARVGRASSITTVWLLGYHVSDFHFTVNYKHISGSRTGSGCAAIFRIQDNYNYYCFRAADSQFFAVSRQKDKQWLNLVDWTRANAIKPNGVNQMEVIAREAHFIFLINGQVVSEVDDDQFSQGSVELAIEGYTPGEETIFDFLDITLRAP